MAPTLAAPSLDYERRLFADGYTLVAGVDEVGRGSWAGPIVAAAVILPCGDPALPGLLDGLRDSKQLSATRREELSLLVLEHATAVGIGSSSHHVIDSLGVAWANRRAMLRAVLRLPTEPDALLLDHFRLPETDLPQIPVTKGDSLCLSIAAASVVAKTVRDRWMQRCEERYPGYDFARNKGYGTAAHLRALERLGPSPLHRVSFSPVAAWSL